MQKMHYSYQTQDKLRKKFGSHDILYGKADPRFPESAEREYIRLMNQYMKIIKQSLEEELPKLKTEYRKQWEEQQALHQDGMFDLSLFLDKFFDSVFGAMQKKLNKFDTFRKLIKRLREIGGITKKTEISEWKRMVKKTLGIDLSEDYYNGGIFDDLIDQWVGENVDLIKTIPHEMLDHMKEIVKEGYLKGTNTTEITKQIQEAYSMSKSHAQMIARDQMSKLNADITRKEHEDAGVTKYRWSTSGDKRVRSCHRSFEGKIFEYDNPPEIWYERDGGRVYTGRHCNPGKDYQCRCVAIPVFEEANIDQLPFADEISVGVEFL